MSVNASIVTIENILNKDLFILISSEGLIEYVTVSHNEFCCKVQF